MSKRCSRHEASPPHMARDQALRFEQRVGRRNRGPVQSNLTSQFTSGWQAATFGERPRLNQLLHLIVELTEKRGLIPRIQWRDQEHAKPSKSISYWLAWMSTK